MIEEFEIVSPLTSIEIIARGRGIHELAELQREFGGRNWRKLKGEAMIKLRNGKLYRAELHWYEGHGIGKRKIKVKRLLD